MNDYDNSYSDLIRIDRNGTIPLQKLGRIPLGTPASEGGVDESTLRDLLFEFPGALPIDSIDAAYANPVAVCRELSTPAGYVDALYVNSSGRLVLAEFKLWRNPQARREVIGQILDYAKEFASWGYEDLQREVSKSLNRRGNVLYELAREQALELDEAVFVDNVSRHLARGEFLLLIIGDGIREGVESIVEFVQRHSGLHFNLALVEAALYRDSSDQIIVQPRCLARTEVIQRFVYGEGESRNEIDDEDDSLSDRQQENIRFWTAVLDNYAFKDVVVEVPKVSQESNIYVKVPGSGFGDYGLTFTGFVNRSGRNIGCFLTCRKGISHAERTFERIKSDLTNLQTELGEDLIYWEKLGRPRIGFVRDTQLPFPPDGPENQEFGKAVAWMRDRLDLLVSALHSKLK
ncbi:MAG: hypothetical protein OXG90_07590 [Gammaproteobacteria bacterium]|nr:hypothetical protein [Gammaproteobacteria bacterium]MYA36751.1 hypothetical protein [Gammaproteobacteria bacterium]